MKNFKIISMIFVFLFLTVSCSSQERNKADVSTKKALELYVNDVMRLHNIPGLALAVIDDEQVVYKGYFGNASVEDNKVVDKNTLFRIFSATKLITSTGIFQLIEKGKVNLEDEISNYLDNLPRPWREIRIKNLLSHSSGLPDIIRYKSTLTDVQLMEKLSNDSMEFSTGSQFSYNQTNYWLLAQIIEKVTGTSFDQFIIQNQFKNTKEGVLFSSNSQAIIPNRATRYFYSPKTRKFEKDTNNSGERGHSGNGLNITLDKFIEWNKLLDTNKLLNERTKNRMWSPFNFTNQTSQFAHGWGNYNVNKLSSIGFTGGNLAAFRKFTNEKATIILLSNGYEIPAYDIIVNDIARIAIPKLKDKDLTLEEGVMKYIMNGQFESAKLSFKKLKIENPTSEFDNLKWNINTIGNTLTYEKKMQKALEIFQLTAELFPNWWVAIAGIAETYELMDDVEYALDHYKKAILLNESNEWNYNEMMQKKIGELKNNQGQ